MPQALPSEQRLRQDATLRPPEQIARGIFGPRTAAQGHGEFVLAWALGAKAQELWKNVHQVLSWYCHMRWQLLRTAVFLSLAGRVTWAKGIWANKTLEKHAVRGRPPPNTQAYRICFSAQAE